MIYNNTTLFYFLRFYLFVHERHRERERQIHKQREKQAPCRESNMGLDPRSLGSGPGLKAALNRWATQAALLLKFYKILYWEFFNYYWFTHLNSLWECMWNDDNSMCQFFFDHEYYVPYLPFLNSVTKF